MKHLIFFCLFMSFVSICCAQENAINCEKIYEQKNICPDATCRLSCLSWNNDQKKCEVGACHLKSCFEISAEFCPKEGCQILEGCDGSPVCYEVAEFEPDCGNLAYSGKSNCCEGFKKRCGVEYMDGSCDLIPNATAYTVPMCLPCGNGRCDQFENRCNCPEDCGKRLTE